MRLYLLFAVCLMAWQAQAQYMRGWIKLPEQERQRIDIMTKDQLYENNLGVIVKDEAGMRQIMPGKLEAFYDGKDTFTTVIIEQVPIMLKALSHGPVTLYIGDEMALHPILKDRKGGSPLDPLATNAIRSRDKGDRDIDTPAPVFWLESGQYLVVNPVDALNVVDKITDFLPDYPKPMPRPPTGRLRLPMSYFVEVVAKYNLYRSAKDAEAEAEFKKKGGF